jgi:hypothetical protein
MSAVSSRGSVPERRLLERSLFEFAKSKRIVKEG